jgi:hypothetical protein
MPFQICKPIDYLVWIGDSWTAGFPGPAEKSFPALVGNNLGINVCNYARPGSSIPELLIQFDQWKSSEYFPDKNYILIACITGNNRFYWKNDDWFTVAPWDATADNVKNFYKHAYNKEAVDFYNTSCIGNLKNLCNDLNIPLYLIRNFEHMFKDCEKYSLFDTGLLQFLLDDNNIVWNNDIKNQIKDEQIGKGLFTSCGHPNDAGYKKIADVLTDKLRFIIEGE